MVARDPGGGAPPPRAPPSPPSGAAPRRWLDPPAKATRKRRAGLPPLFTDYLRAAKTDRYALSTLPPGRFLMPGDLEGSPALTFAPLPVQEGAAFARRQPRGR